MLKVYPSLQILQNFSSWQTSQLFAHCKKSEGKEFSRKKIPFAFSSNRQALSTKRKFGEHFSHF